MPQTRGKLTDEIRKLKDRLPVTFSWFSGRSQPKIGQEEILFWEDVDAEIAKILMRRGSKTYVFTSYLQTDSTPGGTIPSDITIYVDAHAHRHASSSSVSSQMDIGADPLRPYNFIWTGTHSWSPAFDVVPVTINKTSSLASGDLFRVLDTDSSFLFDIDNEGLVGINKDPTGLAMLVIQGGGGGIGVVAPEAWFYAESLGSPGTGSEISTWPDSSVGGAHTATGGKTDSVNGAGISKPQYFPAGDAKATPNLPAVSLATALVSLDNVGYFTFATPLTATAAAGWVVAFIYTDWGSSVESGTPYILGKGLADDQEEYVRAQGFASTTQLWHTGQGSGDQVFSTVYSHTAGSLATPTVEYVVLRCDSAANGNVLSCWINGVLQSTAGGSRNTDGLFRYLCRYDNGSSGGFYRRSISEFIFWDVSLSDSDVGVVNTYLAGRLAGTTPAGGSSATRDLVRLYDASDTLRSRFDENGFLGIGLDPTSPLHVRQSTSPQFSIEYDDATHAVTTAVASTGATTVAPSAEDAASIIQYLFQPARALTSTVGDGRAIFAIKDSALSASAGATRFIVYGNGLIEIGGNGGFATDAMLTVQAATSKAIGFAFAPSNNTSAGITIIPGVANTTAGVYAKVSPDPANPTAGRSYVSGIFDGATTVSITADPLNMWGIWVRGTNLASSLGTRTFANVGAWKTFPNPGGKNSGNYTNVYGGYISSLFTLPAAAGFTIANGYGLYIEPIVHGTTIANGIFIGADNATRPNFKAIVLRDQNTYITSPLANTMAFGLNNVDQMSLTPNVLSFADQFALQLGSSTGLQIGLTTSEKAAFFGATPVVRQASSVALDTLLALFGFREDGSTTTFDNPISAPNLLTTEDIVVLENIYAELKAMRRAMVVLATEGSRARPEDFDPNLDRDSSPDGEQRD